MSVDKCWISSLDKNQSHFSFLLSLGFSKSRIKKYSFSKKWLEKKISNPIELPLSFVNQLMINPIYEGPIPKVLFEDEDFLVLDKPRNHHCHPQSYLETDTLLNYLRSIGSEVTSVNFESWDRGLLHRLDYETTGVLVFAKKENVLKEMRDQFHSAFHRKTYLALTTSAPKQNGKISIHVSESGEKGKKMKVVEEGQFAELNLRFREVSENRFFA